MNFDQVWRPFWRAVGSSFSARGVPYSVLEAMLVLKASQQPPKTAFEHHSQNLTSIKINNNVKDQIYKLYREDFKNFNYEK